MKKEERTDMWITKKKILKAQWMWIKRIADSRSKTKTP